MIDARISIGLPTHPKTKKLIRRVGAEGAWKFVCLILWAAQNRPDGDLSGMSEEDIELAVDWTGQPDVLVSALVEVGFLDADESGYRLHDWAEHNPWAAGSEARSEKSKWAALCKQHGKSKAAELMPDYARRLNDSASSSQNDATGTKETAIRSAKHSGDVCQNVPSAVPDSPRGTDKPPSGSAPSPLPSPLPSPTVENPSEPTVPPALASGEQQGSQEIQVPDRLPCPVEQIVGLFHELMPRNPRCKVLNPARRKAIAARWREAACLATDPFLGGYSTRDEGLAKWREFFAICNESPFLTGRVKPQPGKPPFFADVDFLFSPSGFAKTLENRYHREAA